MVGGKICIRAIGKASFLRRIAMTVRGSFLLMYALPEIVPVDAEVPGLRPLAELSAKALDPMAALEAKVLGPSVSLEPPAPKPAAAAIVDNDIQKHQPVSKEKPSATETVDGSDMEMSEPPTPADGAHPDLGDDLPDYEEEEQDVDLQAPLPPSMSPESPPQTRTPRYAEYTIRSHFERFTIF